MSWPGFDDVQHEAQRLAARIPQPLAPLARVAYNYRWSWAPDGPPLFRDLDPHRWELCDGNPVRLLEETSPGRLVKAARDPRIVERARVLAALIDDDLERPPMSADLFEAPIAFFCAEFGVHGSLPVYSGGLGILAGDVVKEASDRALPLVGVGLMYRHGYFHQRLDISGWQHEFWIETDPERLPAARVTAVGGEPLHVTVSIRNRPVTVQVWRVDVGRVPLYLLDTELAENSAIDRWITSRLYIGDPSMRLAQYAVLGIAGIRILRALGIDPSVVHLNEGHAGLATLELAAERVARGETFDEAIAAVRQSVVFTTHTPVPAGNETYDPALIMSVVPDLPARLGIDEQRLLDLGRAGSGDPGIVPLAMRMSRRVNGVSRRHGEVARAMWTPLFPGRSIDEVPITHVTNGVHPPSWVSPPFRALFDRYLGADWVSNADDAATWEPIDDVPDAELWAARNAARTALVHFVRTRAATDRLARGEPMRYVEAAEQAFGFDTLTVGFARRLATYKRLHLVTGTRQAAHLFDEPQAVQLLLAGKAHPLDDTAKRTLQSIFDVRRVVLTRMSEAAFKAAYLEDYDLRIAATLVGGCDVWMNLPRPPMEASGTSGMKAIYNGVLNVSVLDGWWAEGYDGDNGWAIDGDVDDDHEAQDRRHGAMLYDILQREVVPMFYERDAAGIPRRWVARMKRSIRTLAPVFCTARMLAEYRDDVYEIPQPVR